MKRLLSVLCVLSLLMTCFTLPVAHAASATAIMLEESTATVNGKGASITGTTVLISAAGDYIVSGTFTGQLLVDAGKDAEVNITLKDASVTNPDGPALLISSAKEATIILSRGSENTLISGAPIDGTTAQSDAADETDTAEASGAALQAKCDLKLDGDGSLFVGGYINQGIRTSKDLTFKDGSIVIEAAATGVKVKDKLRVKGGSIAITAGGDGMHAAAAATDTEEADGSFLMTGGTLTIHAQGDAIQSENTLTIEGGTLRAVTGGGSAAAPAHASDWGMRGDFTRWDMDAASTSAESTVSCKGLKAAGALTVSGGEVTIDAYDDALHTADTLTVSGGTLSLSSGDDGIHADARVAIDGGAIDVLTSYEGVEAMHITVTGGDIRVNASDDGFNASSGTNSGFGWGMGFGGFNRGGKGGMDHGARSDFNGFNRGGWQQGGNPQDMPDAASTPPAMPDGNMQQPPQDGTMPAMPDGATPQPPMDNMAPGNTQPENTSPTVGGYEESDSMPSLVINGGTVYVNAQGDGLDSNGDLRIDGGLIIVDGPSNSGNGALDSGTESGGVLLVNGGTVLAIGAAGMAECFDSSSTQAFVSVSLSWQAGAEITITNAEGTVLLRHQAAKSGQSVIFTDPSLKEGDVLTITAGEQSTTATAGFVSNGYGGFGGGFGRGRW